MALNIDLKNGVNLAFPLTLALFMLETVKLSRQH